jgi:DNA-binding MarR family transcriptional regulator
MTANCLIHIVMRYNRIMENARTEDQLTLRHLAEFRGELRKFLHFSERCAAEAGLQPQQHQLLLQIAGAPDGEETTITYAAERLGLRHHTVVELSKRCEEAGLLERNQDERNRRKVRLEPTSKGQRLLASLASAHKRELQDLAPKLIQSLLLICVSDKRASGEGKKTMARSRGFK